MWSHPAHRSLLDVPQNFGTTAAPGNGAWVKLGILTLPLLPVPGAIDDAEP